MENPTYEAQVAEAVELGAKLLDENLPGWYSRIDLADLDIESPDWCILGQLYPSYKEGVNRLSSALSSLFNPSKYGFDVSPYYEREDMGIKLPDALQMLEDAWTELINQRLVGNGTPTHGV